MNFAADAIADLIAPPVRAPESAAAPSEPGVSFAEHLEQAAPEREPSRRAPKHASVEDKNSTPEQADAAAALTPLPELNAAPVLIQLAASLRIAAPTPVLDAPAAAIAPQADAILPAAALPISAPITRPIAAPALAPAPTLSPPAANANAAFSPPAAANGGAHVNTAAEVKPADTKASPVFAPPTLPIGIAEAVIAPQAPAEQTQAALLAPAVLILAPAPPTQPPPTAPYIAKNAETQGIEAEFKLADGETKAALTTQTTEAAAPKPLAQPKSGFAALVAKEAFGGPDSAPPPLSALAPPASASPQPGAPIALAVMESARAAPVAAQIGHEIIRRFAGETTRFELRLDPPELGRIDVRLDVSRDNRVTALIYADNPQALGELTRHARELEQALQSAGLELTDDGLSFGLSQHRKGYADARDTPSAPRADGEVLDTADSIPLHARPLGLESWRGVRVNIVA